ncbi:MAG: hypothetical protein KF729_00015 [Sandaracinaceae bacterium]|nr:hypothetical protein [Sandaracinaceae bacterium]
MIRVTPPRDFYFDGLADQQSLQVVVAEGIDVTGFDLLDLLVRVHADAAIPNGASIEVAVLSDGHTLDDPSRDFFTNPIGVVIFDSNSVPAAGTLRLERVDPPLGSMLAVRVKGSRDQTGGNIRARLSVDLVMKTS